MHSTIMDPTVGTRAGFIVEPIDVLTMNIRIPMVDIITDHIPMDIHITLDDITHITDHITMEDFIFPTPEVVRKLEARTGRSSCQGAAGYAIWTERQPAR
jgi:hypothetical protein